MATNVKTLSEKLSAIQVEFKSNKSRYNSFGKYNFRSAEDILEGLKPFNVKYGVYFTISEDYIYSHDLPVIISKAAIHDNLTNEVIEVKAIVGVDLVQKGMQTPQAFGSASSYGKKYALGNLLLIDDTADADASNTHGKTEVVKTKLDVKDAAFSKAKTFVETGGSIDTIKGKYELTKEAELILSKL
jgi:hypothetical protein